VPRNARDSSDCIASPNARVSGGGRFPALVIVRDVPARDARPLIIARYPAEGGGYLYSSNCSGDLALPAGKYLVYLLPDGAAASFTIHLAGLRGSIRPIPRVPVAYDVQRPLPVVASGAGPLYMAGSVGRLRRRRLPLTTTWTRS